MNKESINSQITYAKKEKESLDQKAFDEKVRSIGRELVRKHIGALKELAK